MKTKIRVFELDPVKGRPPGTLSISATKIKGRGWNPASVSAYMYGLEFDPAIRNVDPIGYRRLSGTSIRHSSSQAIDCVQRHCGVSSSWQRKRIRGSWFASK